MSNFVEGSPVVIVDGAHNSHTWHGTEGAYVRGVTEEEYDDYDHPYQHKVALAHPNGGIGMTWFYDDEVKHPWEV